MKQYRELVTDDFSQFLRCSKPDNYVTDFRNTQVLNGELPQISSWNINNRIPTSSINVGTVDTTPNLIEFSSARSATVVKCKTPESKTHESEANQRVSDIRVIDERNTEVHLAKSSPVYYWETSLGKFEFSPEEFPSKLKLLYIFIRVSQLEEHFYSRKAIAGVIIGLLSVFATRRGVLVFTTARVMSCLRFLTGIYLFRRRFDLKAKSSKISM